MHQNQNVSGNLYWYPVRMLECCYVVAKVWWQGITRWFLGCSGWFGLGGNWSNQKSPQKVFFVWWRACMLGMLINFSIFGAVVCWLHTFFLHSKFIANNIVVCFFTLFVAVHSGITFSVTYNAALDFCQNLAKLKLLSFWNSLCIKLIKLPRFWNRTSAPDTKSAALQL